MAEKRRRGRPVLGAVAGLGFGVLVAVDLILAGWIRLDTAWPTALVVLGLALGITLGLVAPIRRRRSTAPTTDEPATTEA